ncbi:MAG: Unknown protein [uncultured Aureispira sp.]|uniref:Copper-binding protein MbnP-like domain-containing protein n=1 Tax=uncultured Aureispira sp. TaxID=1331704 RepID=A0A6S6TTB2_9BACT|nr:MAG: Unknown protein [uncultured Aureispira sp.]
MHPRAKNFSPEADQDQNDVCDYYELQLQMQHYANTLLDDTLKLGNWLYDANSEPFYLSTMNVLAGELHLIQASDGAEIKSPESAAFFNSNSTPTYAEDNFFISKPESYAADITGWTELGDFDRLRFHLGIPDAIRKTSPALVTEQNHPLSTSGSAYMFDSTSMSYLTAKIVVVQPNSGTTLTFDFFDYIPIELPYLVTVQDGVNIPIRLRLDYLTLFNGISFSNDSSTVVKDKIRQNFLTAFSTY